MPSLHKKISTRKHQHKVKVKDWKKTFLLSTCHLCTPVKSPGFPWRLQYFRCSNQGLKWLLLVFQWSLMAHQLELAGLSSNMTESKLKGIEVLNHDFFKFRKNGISRNFSLTGMLWPQWCFVHICAVHQTARHTDRQAFSLQNGVWTHELVDICVSDINYTNRARINQATILLPSSATWNNSICSQHASHVPNYHEEIIANDTMTWLIAADLPDN